MDLLLQNAHQRPLSTKSIYTTVTFAFSLSVEQYCDRQTDKTFNQNSPKTPLGVALVVLTQNSDLNNSSFMSYRWRPYFFLPLDFAFEVEVVEATLDARDGDAELPLDLTLSKALFCSNVSQDNKDKPPGDRE